MAGTKGARTPLNFRKIPGGVHAIVSEDIFPGNVFFVDSGHAAAVDNTSHGSSPDNPFATINFAVTQCDANNGDYIFVLPGHTETISGAGELDLDVAGITIRGLGNGTNRPTITLDTIDSVDVDIDAANITVENLIFSANIDDIVAGIDVNADDFTMRNCEFTDTAGTKNFLICIQAGSANQSDRMTIEGCLFHQVDTAGTHAIEFGAAQDRVVIQNNRFLGDWGTIVIGGTGVLTLCQVNDNYIHNVATTADSGIDLAASTGMVMNNRVGIALGGDATTGISADNCSMCENYVVDTGDRQGVLDPAAT